MTKITRWNTGVTIHEHDGGVRSTVVAAAKLGISCLRANLCGAGLRSADLCGADLRDDLKIASAKVYTGLYKYVCMAIISDSGVPWVRMGCLWKKADEWDAIGIRASNESEFPDDGSEKSEERARAFAFVRSEALLMAERFQQERPSE